MKQSKDTIFLMYLRINNKRVCGSLLGERFFWGSRLLYYLESWMGGSCCQLKRKKIKIIFEYFRGSKACTNGKGIVACWIRLVLYMLQLGRKVLGPEHWKWKKFYLETPLSGSPSVWLDLIEISRILDTRWKNKKKTWKEGVCCVRSNLWDIIWWFENLKLF